MIALLLTTLTLITPACAANHAEKPEWMEEEGADLGFEEPAPEEDFVWPDVCQEVENEPWSGYSDDPDPRDKLLSMPECFLQCEDTPDWTNGLWGPVPLFISILLTTAWFAANVRKGVATIR